MQQTTGMHGNGDGEHSPTLETATHETTVKPLGGQAEDSRWRKVFIVATTIMCSQAKATAAAAPMGTASIGIEWGSG